MSDQVNDDGFWRADTEYGRIIEKVVTSHAGVATPRRITHTVLRALGMAGYTVRPVSLTAPPAVSDAARAPGVHPKVVPIGVARQPHHGTQVLINMLEAVLKDARSGNISFAAVATATADGLVQPAWAGEFKPVTVLAAVTDLRLRIEAEYLASTEMGGAA